MCRKRAGIRRRGKGNADMTDVGKLSGDDAFSRVRYEKRKPAIDGSYFVKEQEKKAPYSELAENGMIQYKGVVFVCDDANQALCLGDMTDEKNVLTIPLEKGGCLKVNRSNIGDLSRAITMFSAEDVRRILAAIAQDAQCTRKYQEIEEMEDSVMNVTADHTEEDGGEQTVVIGE